MNRKQGIKRNIYKLDDICLVLSYIILTILIINLISLLPDILLLSNSSKGFRKIFIFPIILTIIFIFLQITGRIVRKKEKVLQNIIDLIIESKSITFNNLSNITGINNSLIQKLAEEIQKHNPYYIIIRGNRISLNEVDTHTISYTCDICGAAGSDKISLYTVNLKCLYCGSPIDTPDIEKTRNRIYQLAQEKTISTEQQKKLNIGLVIFLAIFFQPGLIIYLAYYSINKNKGTAFMNGIKNHGL